MESSSEGKTGTDEEKFHQVLQHVKEIIATSKSNSNEIFLQETADSVGGTSTLKELAQQMDTSTANKNIGIDANAANTADQNATLPSFNNVEFGVNELLLLVNEYEILKEKYVTLEKEVETKLPSKENNIENLDVDKLLEEIESLKSENKRLNKEIEGLTTKTSQESDLNGALQKTINRLEDQLKEQKLATNDAIEKLAAHDAAAKRAITVLQRDMGARVEQVTKMYEESLSEKDAYIIKISKLEALFDEVQQNNISQSKKVSEKESTLENLKSSLKSKESEYAKVVIVNETHEKEIGKLNKKTEQHKDEIEAQEMKVKWAQNKLKIELDAHKETKKQITQLMVKLQEAKEEGAQIRQNCQEMIARYQGDEEIKSVQLNKELEEQGNKLKLWEIEVAKQDEENKQKDQELEVIKEENKKLLQEISDQKSLVILLEGKNKNLTTDLSERVKDCAEMKTSIEELKEQTKDLQDTKIKVSEYDDEIMQLKKQEENLQQQINEYEIEVKQHKEKQHEILLYSQSLTENNVSSKSIATDLQSKLDVILMEKEKIGEKLRKSEKEYKRKIEELEQEKTTLQNKVNELTDQLDKKTKTVTDMTASLEEAQDELKVIKKRNAAQMKDLQRQLHQTTRKIEKMESNYNGSVENLSIRSRTSSCNSLEKIHTDSPPNYSSSPQMPHESVMIPQDHYISQPNKLNGNRNTSNTPSATLEIEVDKKVLVERICKLQRFHAKKNEKIEFMEEHINHLTEDLQKKSKIIQYYISREEAGSLAPDQFDRNKADVSQHGGIMASVYSGRPIDKGMTLELSLTINRKLQAVLEDTILKSVMLKENINTLGMEIARLQDELRDAKKS